MNRIQLEKILKEHNISDFGIAPFPEDKYLIPCRAKSRIPEHVSSMIVCLFPYYSEQPVGNISKYAMVPDYHTIVGNLLGQVCQILQEKTGALFVPFVDNSPIPEVHAAVQAGLGFRGQNGLLITKSYGTYQFIGTIVTDLYLEPDCPSEQSCFRCGKCQDACPGNAICSGRIQTKRCASHISQKKKDLEQWEILILKKSGLVWGCDICQEVCPHNQNIQRTQIAAFLTDIVPSVTEETVPLLVKDRAFGFRGPKPLLRNLSLMKGNYE